MRVELAVDSALRKSEARRHVSCGSLADIARCQRHVRFAPDNGHRAVASANVPNPIVLDSLSISQSTQGFDGEFWGQELAEEGDYLSGACGDKDFAQRVEAESEQRARAATMVFDGNGMQARHGD